ncbi:MAG: XRE family transcriptional regulator [Bacteroidia bacterium]
MQVNKLNIRLIFGLKVKHLRAQKGLSFAELSRETGISVSYLNEIEKGKKYPKADKIALLAKALGVSFDHLVSLKLNKRLAPVAELLNSGMLNSIPLGMFGLEMSTVLDLISAAPTKINAFINTLIKISRSYAMSEENFYFAALRSYQEMHNNYFEELETSVDNFVREYNINTNPPVARKHLIDILIKRFYYNIDRESMRQFPELASFRSVFVKEKRRLYINDSLTQMQQSFIIGKEIAFHYLQLEERPYTSNLFQVSSFEEVLNNFKASYFSVALLMNRHQFIRDLSHFFDRESWDTESFRNIIDKYEASPEMFLHRLTNLLPKYFGIDNFFFIRVNETVSEVREYHITKELHFSRLHNPHRNDVHQHYCRRWISIKSFEHLAKMEQESSSRGFLVDVQRAMFIGTQNEYLTICITRPNSPTPESNVSVSMGIQIDAAAKRRIRFLNNNELPIEMVNETCQKCSLMDCEQRVAPPSVLESAKSQELIQKKLEELKVL